MDFDFIANTIKLFHWGIILFVILGAFSTFTPILILHIVFCISLLTHWMANNDACSLTIFESHLRGIKVSDGFLYQYISPMYNISQTEWSKLCYIITVSLMIVSIYNLYNNKDFKNAISNFKSEYKTSNNIFLLFVNSFFPLLILQV